MPLIQYTYGSDTYELHDIVIRDAERGLYGAGTYVEMELLDHTYPPHLAWRSAVTIVLHDDSEVISYHYWNMTFSNTQSVPAKYYLALRAAMNQFHERRQEVRMSLPEGPGLELLDMADVYTNLCTRQEEKFNDWKRYGCPWSWADCQAAFELLLSGYNGRERFDLMLGTTRRQLWHSATPRQVAEALAAQHQWPNR